MKILAIEASALVAGCALLEDDVLVGEYSVQHQKTHSQTLLPMMDELKKLTQLDLKTVDAIAVTKGPGSFTGLRIGAATAKGLGLALDIPVIPVPTVEAIAYNLFAADALICPLMDARRGQVYTGIYDSRNGFKTVKDQCAVPVSEIIDELNTLGSAVIFMGDGAKVHEKTIEESIHVPHRFAPAHLCVQRPASVAALAMQMYREKGDAVLVPADDFRLEYLRVSQAERQRQQAQEAGMMDSLAAGTLVKDTLAAKDTAKDTAAADGKKLG